MMENVFRVSVSLRSDDFDFADFPPQFQNYKVTVYEKGQSTIKGEPASKFTARKNAFIISDICITNKIDYAFEDSSGELIALIEKIDSLVDKNVQNINREIRISGQINNQQFGIGLSANLINTISNYKYSVVFSGIAYLDERSDNIPITEEKELKNE